MAGRLRTIIVSVVLLLSLTTVPRGASAGPGPTATKKQVAELVSRAVTLQKQGDHAAAVPVFSEAYALRPDPIILFLKARSHMALQQHAEARDAYVAVRRYPKQVGPKNMLELERNLTRCNEELKETRVHVVTTGVAGASLLVDGRFVGTSPLDLPLRRGVYTVRVEKEGYESLETTLHVATEADMPFEVALKAVVKPKAVTDVPVVASAPDVKASKGLSRRTWAWIAAGTGVVALGTGLGFLGDYAVKKGRTIGADEQWEGGTANLAVGGTLAGAGVALGTTAIVLFLTDGRKAQTEEVGLFLLPTSGGMALGVSGSW